MGKVFLDELPKKGTQIDWINSVGCKVGFIYDDIDGELEIVDYNSKKHTVFVKYKDEIFPISSDGLRNCKLGSILKKITIDFKFNIGDIFKDDNRDIIITKCFNKTKKDGYKIKYYNYKCNICGWGGGEIDEYSLLKNIGCSCCYGRTVVEGINDIPTTAPWMVKYFQGGYDEAKLYTRSSNKKIYPICPDCGEIKRTKVSIGKIYNSHSIGCICSDGISYPEKFVSSVLKQVLLNCINQVSKKHLSWIINDKRYDLGVLDDSNNITCIIEIHGKQHYSDDFYTHGIDKKERLEREKLNDAFKKELAIKNGIENYIVINARYSELEWIKNSIMSSKLPKLFNFTKKDIDWGECEQFALSNLVKEICSYKNKHYNHSAGIIAGKFNISRVTVGRYLKKGAKLGWCNYNPKDEMVKSAMKNGGKNKKPVICTTTNKTFASLADAAQCYNLKSGYSITQACQGKQKSAGKHPETGEPLHWMYYEDYLKLHSENNALEVVNQ